MLLSVVAVLKAPLPQGKPIPFLGRAAHAVFLSLIAKKDPSLATQLHDEDGPRPYTASFLINPPGAAAYAFVRFTCCTPEVSQTLLAVLKEGAPAQLTLDDQVVLIEGWFLEPSEHPWVNRTTYHEMVARWWRAHQLRNNRITLAFVSPTTFRSRNQNIPFPLPELVFGSLLERWNALAPLALEPKLRDFFRDSVAVSGLRLQSTLINVAGGKQVGFLGTCSYLTTQPEPYAVAALNILADFAFYAGVGAKTTMGMGQTRRV